MSSSSLPSGSSQGSPGSSALSPTAVAGGSRESGPGSRGWLPVVPDSAPFNPEQRAWLNGFLAGLFSRAAQPGRGSEAGAGGGAGAGTALLSLTILYGSQSGAAEGLARKASKEAGRSGFVPTVLDMAKVGLERLAAEGRVLVITSTYGDGEPPDNARSLLSALKGGGPGPALGGLRYAVCAIGDSNYTLFCQCGRDFDALLEKRGAVRVAPRVECDVGREDLFARWLPGALAALATGVAAGRAGEGAGLVPSTGIVTGESAGAGAAMHSRNNPFAAPILAVRRLNGAGSAKEVNHVEISLEGSALTYEAGDALGVYPRNAPDKVEEVLHLLGCDGEEEVPGARGGAVALRRALEEDFCLGKPREELTALLGGTAGPPHEVLDVLRGASGPRPGPDAFVAALRRLQPRLYSISSSPKAHPGQVHLTVGAVRFEAGGRARKGVCSTFLAERALAIGRAPVFVHPNRMFRPPSDPRAPAIMVGPGTGIAPFRAFLEERRETGATGRNWLFFGDQTQADDYLYREEIGAFLKGGTLSRVDTAFSRDQREKVYVQHRMLEAAAELFAWLEAGAHFYVCGDASRMAKDVNAALQAVVERAAGRSPEQAAEYVEALRGAGRYARDVY